MKMKSKTLKKPVFVDAFAGCGGLSLGLSQAGLEGLFAIERDSFAFETFRMNFLEDGSRYRFNWPEWLPKEPVQIEKLLAAYEVELKSLKGTVDLLVGGPPCQGFSSAGRRKHNDPRNKLFASYTELVELLEPKAVLIENVRGFTVDFSTGAGALNYANKLKNTLSKKYDVYEQLFNLSEFGLPQNRTRYFLLALKPGIYDGHPFEALKARLPAYLRSLGLQTPVPSRAALSDLEVTRCGTRPSAETKGFFEIDYKSPLTGYQKLMSADCKRPGDLRLARHSPKVSDRFAEIIEHCHAEGRLNTTISDDLRKTYGLKKRAIRVLDPDRPSPTVTSMPDDLLHYNEPRTLTVRENARLQGFPDWFAFKGKYTTGGHLRAREVPRFTQVANAVPPLVSQALGRLLFDILAEKPKTQSRRKRLLGPAKAIQKASEINAHT